jgi:hypothetical protein
LSIDTAMGDRSGERGVTNTGSGLDTGTHPPPSPSPLPLPLPLPHTLTKATATTVTAPTAPAASAAVPPYDSNCTAKNGIGRGLHPGAGLETHIRMWQRRSDRLLRLSRQLLCQASTDLQFADVWVEDALAMRRLTEGVEVGSRRLVGDHKQTEIANASDLLGDQNVRMRVEEARRKSRRLQWMGRTSQAVVGKTDREKENKCAEVDLTPTDENDRKVSLRNGPTVRDKKRTVLSAATRVYYWSSVNLRTITTRTCVVVPPNALHRAVCRVRKSLDHIMQIEPGSDEQACLTKMIYQTAMGVSMREVFLQTHRSRTAATNPITVMNRSLSPAHITEIQAAFMGRKLQDLYTDPSFLYHDILDLCLWSYHVNIRTRIDWLQKYCLYGDGFQDKIQHSFEGTIMGRARTPMVALVAGQWCVLEGTDLLYLCRTTLEACTLWMLLVWTKHAGTTDKRMNIDRALRWSFENDDGALELLWLTENRKRKWSDRLDPAQKHIIWKRRPGPIVT